MGMGGGMGVAPKVEAGHFAECRTGCGVCSLYGTGIENTSQRVYLCLCQEAVAIQLQRLKKQIPLISAWVGGAACLQSCDSIPRRRFGWQPGNRSPTAGCWGGLLAQGT
jgi:hypothetical protein